MKRNVIIILIDGLNRDYLGSKEYKESPSPYIDNLMKKSLSFDNVFSSAPYTEGAMIELMAGYQTLSNNTFLENLKYAPKTLFECFAEQGYDVFSSIYYYPDAKGFKRGVSHQRVIGLANPSTLYSYRFKYYAELYQKKELLDEEYHVLNSLMKELIEVWEADVNGLLKNDNKYRLIKNNSVNKENLEKQLCFIQKIKQEYIKDERTFIDDVLKQRNEHLIFKQETCKNFPQSNKFTELYLQKLAKYQDVINKMSMLQKKGNRKYCFELRSFVSLWVAALKKCVLSEGSLYDRCSAAAMQLLEASIYTDYNIKKVFSKNANIGNLKDTACAKIQLDDFMYWLKNERNDSKPYAAFIHLDDIHVNPIPFSYGIDDDSLFEEEMSYMKKYVDGLTKNYHGNILYDVAIHHIDKKIQKFVEQLRADNELKNTDIILTSDHGFYYSYQKLRKDSIENAFKENYHILFNIYREDDKFIYLDKNLYSQRDIPYTLCKLYGLEVPKSFSGMNMLEHQGRKINVLEYPGRGCPDLKRKTLIFAAYDNKYKIVVKTKLFDRISYDNIKEIYYLEKDEFETKNLVAKCDKDKINYLFIEIKKRLESLQNEYSSLKE